jgi:hypothetical protein
MMVALLALSLLTLEFSTPVHSQGEATLKGKTRTVALPPNGTVDAGKFVFKKDSDNDGMPDADEAANGTNPNDPSDADGDADGDGLTNGDEVALDLSVNNADSDGDGVSDGEEVSLGYDPNDPNSTPPANTGLASLQVTPSTVNISLNALLGQDFVELHVTGVRTDGTTFDLTGSPSLTFTSLDENVALVDSFGSVVGIDAGSTTIRVASGTVSADTPVLVSLFTPSMLSELDLPGYANNVDVAQDYAYVAAGEAGLVVINVNDRSNPVVVATLNTPGNANDVRVVGSTAYVADGPSGLQIIDVSTPAIPVLLGSLDTPGGANDVAVSGTRAYVADGDFGLRIVDISNPSAPTLLGFVDTPGTAWGVAVSGDLAVVADGLFVLVVDAANPAAPVIVGSAETPSLALDLEVQNRYAYVATYGSGLQLVDFSVPADPRIIASTADGFNLKDIALGSRYAAGADGRFLNFALLFDLGDPGAPDHRANLDFSPSGSPAGSFYGTGLAISGPDIYMTATDEIDHMGNGTSGTTKLFILEYQAAQNEVNDTAGIAPTVSITTPQNGESTTQGSRLPISIKATDDVQVDRVELIVNGVTVIEDVAAPYNITYTVPRGATSLTIQARAYDTGGNNTASAPVTVNVFPDPPPTIAITSPAEGQVLAEGEEVLLIADANDNGFVAQVLFTVNGEIFSNFSFYQVPTGVTSLTFEATATDDIGKTATATRTVSVIPDPPPTINIVAPAEGTQLTQGQIVQFVADASDNISVQQVEFSVDGTIIATDTDAPYTQLHTVATGVTTLTLDVTAQDNLGQRTTASRVFTVVPDPGTTVTGRILDTAAQPLAGATVSVFGEFTAQSGLDGTFSIPNTPTVRGEILARATATIGGNPAANASLPTAPVSGGDTDVGTITLSVGPTAPTAVAFADFNRDFQQDIFIGYPDRQSLIYSLSGGQFTLNSNVLLPFGAVNSAANLNLNFGQQQRLLAQLPGRPASVTDLLFDNGAMQPLGTLSTGLAGESDYTATGLDTNGQSNTPAVAAFLTSGSGLTSLTVRFGDNSAQGFGAPLVLPVDSSVPLRSLTLADINTDALLDLIVVKPVAGNVAKLVVYPRTSATTFGSPVESSITVRATVPARGAIDFVLGSLAGNFNKDIAVLGDDRVRIYTGDGTGAFVSSGEVVIPADRIANGLNAVDVSRDGRSDLFVTTRDATNPLGTPDARVYLNTFGGVFLTPGIHSYVAPINAGDTRIGVGQYGGIFNRMDMVVIDGDTVKTLLDVGPASSGS